MRPRCVYLGTDLERLYAEYLTQLPRRAAELGLPIGADDMLCVTYTGLRSSPPSGRERSAKLVPAQSRHRASAGRHTGLSGLPPPGPCPRADHVKSCADR